MAAPDRPQTSALTGVFAPGSPPLMESLRTLVVTPPRSVSPGETIRVEFAFSNLGGAPATNVRVRFALPSGVMYVEGSDTADDAPIENERLVAGEGAALGDLPPNAQRRVACSYRVNEHIEDGSELLFQAALVTDQTPVVASNAERLIVRSEPVLQDTSTFVTIHAPENPKPGDVIAIRATIANTGASSAHDVLAFLPVPLHTRYVARSARIGGRALIDSGDEPFDYLSETVVAQRLTPGQTVAVEYQAAIEAPLTDGTRIKVSGAVSSREIPEFAVQSAEIVVASPADFANDDTALTVFCDDIVSPGTRVPMTMRVLNSGTGDAQNVSITLDLPAGLAYTPGSAHLDGQPVSDEAFAGQTFSLGAVPAGRVADAGISTIVVVQTGQDLPIVATLRWKGPASGSGQAERRFTRTLRVRVSSRFTRARNYIEVDKGVSAAREDVTFTAHVFNDGTAPEPDVALRLLPGAFLENIRIAETPDEPVAYQEPFNLGIVQPHSERTFTVRARVASPVPDRTQTTLGAVLEFASGTYDLGVASVIVRSRPHVVPEACTWERVQSEVLRPGHSHDVTIRFTNDGADVLRDARLDLVLPPELVLERAQNARREGPATLHFGDVPAETTHEARVALRLVRPPKRERTLVLEGTLSGRGISPLQFDPLDIPTYAQPLFEQDAALRANPAENVNAGERVAYEATLRNSGDGAAQRLLIRAVPSNLAVYIPGSTTLNGMTIADDLGTSQLWSQRGLVLTDVNPGIELRVRWEMLVIAPLAAGTPVDTRVVAEWDEEQSLALAAPTLRVLSTPSLQAGAGGTPISVAQLMPALETPAPEAIVPPPQPAIEEVPRRAAPAFAPAEEPAPQAPPQIGAPAEAFVQVERPVLYADFSQEELVQVIRTLEKSDAGGLVQHLFAVRALFPNALAGAGPRQAQLVGNAARAIRAPLDRLFVRLRVPRLNITAKDLEDRDSRHALRGLLQAVNEAHADTPGERTQGVVRLSGPVDVDALRRRAAELEHQPLGSAVPWIVNATLLGSQIEYNGGGRSDMLGLYRAELLKVFGVLETLPVPEFHRVLTSSVNRTLDDALGAVLDALRAAAHVAVD